MFRHASKPRTKTSIPPSGPEWRSLATPSSTSTSSDEAPDSNWGSSVGFAIARVVSTGVQPASTTYHFRSPAAAAGAAAADPLPALTALPSAAASAALAAFSCARFSAAGAWSAWASTTGADFWHPPTLTTANAAITMENRTASLPQLVPAEFTHTRPDQSGEIPSAAGGDTSTTAAGDVAGRATLTNQGGGPGSRRLKLGAWK